MPFGYRPPVKPLYVPVAKSLRSGYSPKSHRNCGTLSILVRDVRLSARSTVLDLRSELKTD